jgi:hypothetical protein
MALFKPFSPVLTVSRSRTKKSVRDALARSCEARARAPRAGCCTMGVHTCGILHEPSLGSSAGRQCRQGYSRETCPSASLVLGGRSAVTVGRETAQGGNRSPRGTSWACGARPDSQTIRNAGGPLGAGLRDTALGRRAFARCDV